MGLSARDRLIQAWRAAELHECRKPSPLWVAGLLVDAWKASAGLRMDRDVSVYVLLHYDEVVGVYSSLANAEIAKTVGHVSCLEPQGWFIDERTLDLFAHEKAQAA